jgi:predicted DNA-binding transcriptional regulator AlpA
MTARKTSIPLDYRLTAYVSREQGARELGVSPSTWDELVEIDQIPKPIRLGRTRSIVRWRWIDVDNKLRGGDADTLNHEPFFRERPNGTTKERRRDAA